MKKLFPLLASLAFLAAPTDASAAPKKYTFKKGQLVTVSGGQCGLVGKKWRAVKKSGKKKYVVDKKGGDRCATLLAPASLKKSGLASIPSASGLLKSAAQASALAVSGAAPAATSISTIGVKNVFWSPGLIDGITAAETPTQEQCSEFFHGVADGQSAGLLGCFAVQGVGYAFQSILAGGNSTCFMKNIPTQANVDSGGVQVIEGSLPGGDITKLFSTPAGKKNRVIKVAISGFQGQNQTGFISIDSEQTLAKRGLQYSYKVWFCNEGQPSASNYEETSVTLDGGYKYFNVFASGANEYQNEISAFLTKDGTGVGFDVTRERVASTTAEMQGANFKALVTLLPNNIITTKVKESFSGFGRSNYGVSQFSGSSLNDFSVSAAALKDVFANQVRQTGIEYRDTLYASAPNSTLTSELAQVDISTDPFFSQAGTVTPDFSGVSCTADSDVTLQMNFAVPSMQLIGQTCAGQQVQNMDFCRSTELMAAFAKCQQ